MNDREAITQLIRDMTNAVLERRPDDLLNYFHADAVLVAPGFEQRVVGRDPAVQSYRDFLAMAVVHRFASAEPRIDQLGDTAVATVPYTMDYELEGKVWRSRGNDLLVLTRVQGKWLIFWRTLLAEPDEEISLTSPAQ
jgi:ketosteroid isomerase-like protein